MKPGRVLLQLVVWFLLVLAGASASAQVNAEQLSRSPFKDGAAGFVQAGVALARGNVEWVNVGGAAYGQWQKLFEPEVGAPKDALPWVNHRVYATANGRFAENANGAFISNAYIHARWTGMWHRRVGSDIFAQYQYNDFIRLSRRALGGLGARFEFVHLKELLIYAGSAYMLEYEKIQFVEDTDDDPETLVHRWTNYLTIRAEVFDGQLLLQNTVYVQPRFDDFGDFRILNTFDLIVKVQKFLAFGTTVSYLHDSRPPTGIKKDDLTLTTNIRVSFQ